MLLLYNINGDRMKPKTKKRLRLKKQVIYVFIFLVPIPILIFSSFKIFSYLIDSPNTKKMIESTIKDVEINDYDSDNAVIIESEEHPDSPYWNYIKMSLIDVDFDNLKSKNEDTVSWLQVGGTNINYPIVKGTDNEFYLSHSFDKSNNKAGWAFMDYRNSTINIDKNTIIYAHNMKDKTMFGTLNNLLTSEWYDVEDNRIIKTSSEKYNMLWQIFSVYTIETTNDYIETSFNNDSEYQEFLDLILGRTFRNFNTKVNTSDNILTLSTCYGSTKKLVVHSKLIKMEEKN